MICWLKNCSTLSTSSWPSTQLLLTHSLRWYTWDLLLQQISQVTTLATVIIGQWIVSRHLVLMHRGTECLDASPVLLLIHISLTALLEAIIGWGEDIAILGIWVPIRALLSLGGEHELPLQLRVQTAPLIVLTLLVFVDRNIAWSFVRLLLQEFAHLGARVPLFDFGLRGLEGLTSHLNLFGALREWQVSELFILILDHFLQRSIWLESLGLRAIVQGFWGSFEALKCIIISHYCIIYIGVGFAECLCRYNERARGADSTIVVGRNGKAWVGRGADIILEFFPKSSFVLSLCQVTSVGLLSCGGGLSRAVDRLIAWLTDGDGCSSADGSSPT